ncbi:MAG: prepilin-type N-terminal cleavage/methylation domain-containing protein [Desulfobacterales bacterium]|nr:prepilin-type N-terminal cleavage/methylation domain-containing protein [Desulfobacterales bacterium]
MNSQTVPEIEKTGDNKGFSLLEVLVAMLILSIGLLTTAALTVGIIQGNGLSKKHTTATTLAREQMEDIRRRGYSGMPAITSTEDYNTIINYPSHKRVTETSANDPGLNMKTITVTVYWDSDNRSVALQTILGR